MWILEILIFCTLYHCRCLCWTPKQSIASLMGLERCINLWVLSIQFNTISIYHNNNSTFSIRVYDLSALRFLPQHCYKMWVLSCEVECKCIQKVVRSSHDVSSTVHQWPYLQNRYLTGAKGWVRLTTTFLLWYHAEHLAAHWKLWIGMRLVGKWKLEIFLFHNLSMRCLQ